MADLIKKSKNNNITREKTALVIFNPTAGIKDRKNNRERIVNYLTTLEYAVDIFDLNKGFEKKIADYNLKLVDLVVAVGGDGTVKVAARTILQNKLDVPLAIIPFGSANVVGMTLGISGNVKAALKLITRNPKSTQIDVGVINQEHYFLVGFSIGYLSRVVMATSEKTKNRIGFLGYVWSLIFNKVRIRKIKFEIKTQNKIFWVKGNSLVVCNSINYFGIKPKKKIDLRDGILNLYVFTNKTFVDMIRVFFYVIWYRKPPKFVFSIDNSYFHVVLNRLDHNCQIDGDSIECNKDIEIEVMKKALKVIIPS